MPFFSAHIFSDSLNDLGFLVTLLYIIDKKVIFVSFRIFGENIWSAVREANATYTKYYLMSKFGPKILNCQFKLKFGTITNSSVQNSVVVFTFFVSKWKYSFWANLVQKIKIVSLCWNLAPSLIWICRIQWWCSLLLFLTGNTLFGQIWSKNSKLSV